MTAKDQRVISQFPEMHFDITDHGAFVLGEQENSKPYIVANVYYGDDNVGRLFATSPALYKACRDLIDYRDHAGPLNFQLEKADDFMREIRIALEAIEGGAS